jgi:hypothetical protein
MRCFIQLGHVHETQAHAPPTASLCWWQYSECDELESCNGLRDARHHCRFANKFLRRSTANSKVLQCTRRRTGSSSKKHGACRAFSWWRWLFSLDTERWRCWRLLFCPASEAEGKARGARSKPCSQLVAMALQPRHRAMAMLALALRPSLRSRRNIAGSKAQAVQSAGGDGSPTPTPSDSDFGAGSSAQPPRQKADDGREESPHKLRKRVLLDAWSTTYGRRLNCVHAGLVKFMMLERWGSWCPMPYVGERRRQASPFFVALLNVKSSGYQRCTDKDVPRPLATSSRRHECLDPSLVAAHGSLYGCVDTVVDLELDSVMGVRRSCAVAACHFECRAAAPQSAAQAYRSRAASESEDGRAWSWPRSAAKR